MIITAKLLLKFSYVFLIVTTFLLAFIIFARSKSRLHLSLGTFLIATSLWIVCRAVAYSSVNAEKILFYSKIALLPLIVSCSAFLYFCFEFQKGGFEGYKKNLIYLASLLFVPFIQSGQLLKKVRIVSGIFYIDLGRLYLFLALFILIIFSLSLYQLSKVYKNNRGRKRLQAKYMILGASVSLLILSVSNFILPLFGSSRFYNLGPPAMIFIVVTVTYAIVKHRLMDLRLIALRSISYTSSLLIITAGYVALAYSLTNVSGEVLPHYGTEIAIITVTIFIFQPVKNAIEQFTDNIFFKGQYDFKKFIKQFNNITIKNSRNFEKLITLVMEKFIKDLRASKAAFIFLTSNGEVAINSIGLSEDDEKMLREYIKVIDDIAAIRLRDEFDEDSLGREYQTRLGFDVLVPLSTENRIEALLFLGEKNSGEEYSLHDLHLLEIIAPQLALAMENARLYEQAITDTLTGLYDNNYVKSRLRHEVDRAKRYNYPFTLMMVDIDHFKDINDKYGHEIGNQVLIETTNLISNSVRKYDVVGRYGGDEFIILLPFIQRKQVDSHEEVAKTISERIRKKIENHEFLKSELKITVSCGVALFQNVDYVNTQLIIDTADSLLYEAKDSGRNNVRFKKAAS